MFFHLKYLQDYKTGQNKDDMTMMTATMTTAMIMMISIAFSLVWFVKVWDAVVGNWSACSLVAAEINTAFSPPDRCNHTLTISPNYKCTKFYQLHVG